jgi:Ca2+-binding RTX toxin-like protein
MRPTHPRIVGVVLATSALLLPSAPAHASVYSYEDHGVLRIFGDAASDSIDVTCVGGNTKVNGLDPDALVPCDAIGTIVVRARGGDDDVTLEHVDTAADFTALVDSFLEGGPGDDAIVGSPAYDEIDGKAGFDTLSGGAGNDELRPGEGGAEIDGGEGLDFVPVTGGGEWNVSDDEIERVAPDPSIVPIASVEFVEIIGGDGVDHMDGTAFTGGLHLVGATGQDELLGGSGRDTLVGSGGHDEIFGAAGRDRLFGNRGDDLLTGGEDDDRLYGGPGTDACVGGPGDDRRDHCE